MTIGRTTPAGISVLDDLGLDRGFVIKAKLAIRIQKTVEELGLNLQCCAANGHFTAQAIATGEG